jgi:hypothetical protein
MEGSKEGSVLGRAGRFMARFPRDSFETNCPLSPIIRAVCMPLHAKNCLAFLQFLVFPRSVSS